ncbi:MAG: hypothetical protein IAE82_02540 [Opitutaceae bacterium]|nr:hypothetical protein [Opitutaceae bacterium]
MNKWYFGIPLIALVAFYIYFRDFSKKDDALMAEKDRLVEVARQEKLEAERQARLKAVEEAKVLLAQRKAEQEDKKRQKEAADAKREEERIALEKAKTEQSQLKVELKDLKEEVADEERLLKIALDQKRAHETEREFVLGYTDAARKNKDRFLQLIDKIEESEKAKLAAAAAAAASKK